MSPSKVPARVLLVVAFLPALALATVGRCLEPQVHYTLVYSFGGLGKGDGRLDNPRGLAVDLQEQVYVADFGNRRLQKFTSAGKLEAKWPTRANPSAVAIGDDDLVYVAEELGDCGLVEVFTTQGKPAGKWDIPGTEFKRSGGKVDKYCWLGGIVVREGLVYLGNNSARAVQIYTTQGGFRSSIPDFRACCGFLDVALDAQGLLYVAELGAFRVVVCDRGGKRIRSWGRQGTGRGQFSPCCNPVHVAIGPDGSVYTSEKTNPRVQVFTNTGKWLGEFGKGVFSEACGYLDLAVGPSGKVYAVEDASGKVYVFSKG